jgi:antitoxin VapB
MLGGKMTKKVIQKLEERTPERSSKAPSVISKVFMNGGSQAVRIPADFRFESDRVRITYDEKLDAVVIKQISGEEAKMAFIEELRNMSEEEKAELSQLKYVKRYRKPGLHPAIEQLIKDSE